MALLSSFNEDRPVSYFRGHPIYCATILTIAYGVGVLATFFAKAFGALDALVSLLAFDTAHSIVGGQIWQIFTYSFVDFPSFFTYYRTAVSLCLCGRDRKIYRKGAVPYSLRRDRPDSRS